MRHLDKKVQQNKLRGVVDDCRQFLGIDPTKKPIPVMPGIHYFMGGILVDRQHRTYHKGLYAAGECACQYHGANRLGGNSLLGASMAAKQPQDRQWLIVLICRVRLHQKRISSLSARTNFVMWMKWKIYIA